MSNPENWQLELPSETEETPSIGGRRALRSPRTAFPFFRLLSMMLMLAVIGITIYNVGYRNRAAIVAVDEPRAAQPAEKPEKEAAPATRPKNRKPVADENPEEFKRFRHESEAILDKATVIRSYELPAYYRVLDWVQSQSLADLKSRSFPEVPFQEFIHHPNKYRGKPVRVELLIRRVLSIELDPVDKDSKPRKIYELWGWPAESAGWLYVVVAPELPSGFPTGANVEVTATVYGYFFKLQGYQPGDAKPLARPLLAPLIMGRVSPVTVAAAPAPSSPMTIIALIVGGIIMIIMFISWIVAARRKPVPRMDPTLNWPDDTVDEVKRD
jgi:hypothetical protein